MKTLAKKARLVLCSLLIVAFFIPSYNGISAFNFIPIAFAQPEVNSEITLTDVLVAVVPLFFIPLSALGILFLFWMKMPARKTYLALPLFSILTFTGILFTGLNSGSAFSSGRAFLMQMGIGFYIALIAAVLLPFTKRSVRKRARQPKSESQVEIAA